MSAETGPENPDTTHNPPSTTHVDLITHWDDCHMAHLALILDGELVYAAELPVPQKQDGNTLARIAALQFLSQAFPDRKYPEGVFDRHHRETVWGRRGQISKYLDEHDTSRHTRKPPKIAEAVKRIQDARAMREEIRLQALANKAQTSLF